MSLTTRPIINPGAELYAPGGAPLNDVRVECVLVGVDGNPCDVIDAITHEPVVGSAAAMIKNGLLPAADDPKALKLWPNNRGNKKTYYRCRVVTEGFGYFMTALVEGDTPLTWVEFVTNGIPLTAQELSALNLHIADDAVHLVPSLADALKTPRINAAGDGIEYYSDTYTHEQPAAAFTWIINHNLGYRPAVEVTDAGGSQRSGSILHTSSNQVVIYFATALAGIARLT